MYSKIRYISLFLLINWKEKYGPIGLVHVDAHTDTSPKMVGCDIAHGTPFYRAVEEGLLDLDRVVQIGLRGTGYSLDDMKWGQDRVSDWLITSVYLYLW